VACHFPVLPELVARLIFSFLFFSSPTKVPTFASPTRNLDAMAMAVHRPMQSGSLSVARHQGTPQPNLTSHHVDLDRICPLPLMLIDSILNHWFHFYRLDLVTVVM
jgi:hypothetical protein